MGSQERSHPGAAAIARLIDLSPDEDRRRASIMERARAEYLCIDRDEEVEAQVRWMLGTCTARIATDRPHGPGNRRECRSVVVVGESGAGKSSICRQTFKRMPALANHWDREADRLLISVELPSPCTLQGMGAEILAELGYAPDRPLGEAEVWRRVRSKLEDRGVLVVHLDEVHNVTETADSREIKKIRKTFKALMANKRWPVALVVSGLPQLVAFMETAVLENEDGCFEVDPVDRVTEVRRRCRFVELKPLVSPHDAGLVHEAAKGIGATADVGIVPDFETAVAPRLIHACLGQFGTCVEIIQDTVELILAGEGMDVVLSPASFAAAWGRRTANNASRNPFLVADWANVNCSDVLNRSTTAIAVVTAQVKKKRKKR